MLEVCEEAVERACARAELGAHVAFLEDARRVASARRQVRVEERLEVRGQQHPADVLDERGKLGC